MTAVRLTARERYGVRAMVALAAAHGVGPMSLADVAVSQRIPFRYLEHVAKSLKQAGLIKSWRGATGGYELARAPEDITVADILRAVEGSVLATECGDPHACSYLDALNLCVTKPLWDTLQRQIEVSLTQITLASVASTLSVRQCPAETAPIADAESDSDEPEG
ncbi:MAG: RrF2 family transcriptional regulator [Anaerolineae bacterium]